MKTEQLRKSILQLAIQGKLVPQDPNDEPASVLLERIRAEKQRLIKEGKIKKDKNDSVIFKGEDNRYYEKVSGEVKDITEDLPFEIPDSWIFVRLSTVCWLGDIVKSTGEKLPYLDAKTLRGKSDKTYLTEDKVVDVGEKVILVDGENSGEVFDIPFRGFMGSTFKTLEKVSQLTFGFLNVVLDYYRDTFRGNKIGAAIPHLNKNLFKSLLIGIPPHAEQARIVAAIEKFEPLIAEYDKLEQQATKLDNEIYDKLKKSILQYAIQGKLVPQDPNDEPASVLLERIRAEKKAKLGKKYVDSYIYKGDDNCYYEHIAGRAQDELVEVPFDIPNTWAWSKIKYVADTQTGTTPSTSDKSNFGNYISFVKPGDLVNGQILYNREMLSEQGLNNGRLIPSNSVIMVCIGGSTGKCALTDRDISCNQQINTATPCQWVLPQYLFFFMASDYFYKIVRANATGTATPIINRSTWENLVLPIPPLAEQKRIVAKINEIFSML